MMLLALLAAWSAAAELELSQVRSMAAQRTAIVWEARSKEQAARHEAQSTEGFFDLRLKGESYNLFENKYDQQTHDVRLEQPLRVAGATLFTGHRQGTGNFAVYEGKQLTSSVGELYAGLDIPLLRNLLSDQGRLAVTQGRLRQRESSLQAQQKSLETVAKASELYWKWVAQGLKLRLVRQWADAALDRQSMLEKRFSSGDLSEFKVIDNRRSYRMRRAELVRHEREFQLVAQELSLYIGGEALTEEKLPPRIPEQPYPVTTLNEPPQSLPVFAILSLYRELLEQEGVFLSSQTLPALNLQLEGARDVGHLPSTQSDPDQLRVGLRLDIPLENRSARGKLNANHAKLTALSHQTSWTGSQWKTQMNQAHLALERLDEQLALQASELQDSEKMTQAERSRLAQGEGDVFLVNLREQDEVSARLRLIDTLALRQITINQRQALDGTLLQHTQ